MEKEILRGNTGNEERESEGERKGEEESSYITGMKQDNFLHPKCE